MDVFIIGLHITSKSIQITYNNAYDAVPCFSNDGSKITFRSDVDGDYEIFVVNSDGTELTQLTHNSVNDYHPSVSGDGSKIAYYSDVDGDYEIFVINSDGTGLTQLTDNTAYDRFPSISGDGTKIAYESDVDGDYEIFVVNSDGTGLTQLTDDTTDDRAPSICSDGSKIAFQSNRMPYMEPEIFVMNSDGSECIRVTDRTLNDVEATFCGDGSKLAFASNLDGDYEIFVAHIHAIREPVINSILVVDQTTYSVETYSNSTVSEFILNQELSSIHFKVSGTEGTTGFCNITIPAELMSGTFSIYKDDVLLVENVDYTQTFNGTHYTFNITYEHSSHTIEIFSTSVIPELTSLIMIATFTIATIAVAIYGNKSTKKKKS